MLRNLYDYIGSANLNNFWNNFIFIRPDMHVFFFTITMENGGKFVSYVIR